ISRSSGHFRLDGEPAVQVLIGFVVFRIVDILKPWPISWVDRNVHGGVGIMLDDVLAGVFAWLVMQGLVWGWVHWLV
ncbi:phosphatidylglycerophosphatase A, partial [Pseudomonas aeruginosa]|uniref:phosphatidylglycerophosphatase A family protein n=1 Tax=Pseudomonas aeruginosa TaxID=287 RepID=UPI003968147A